MNYINKVTKVVLGKDYDNTDPVTAHFRELFAVYNLILLSTNISFVIISEFVLNFRIATVTNIVCGLAVILGIIHYRRTKSQKYNVPFVLAIAIAHVYIIALFSDGILGPNSIWIMAIPFATGYTSNENSVKWCFPITLVLMASLFVLHFSGLLPESRIAPNLYPFIWSASIISFVVMSYLNMFVFIRERTKCYSTINNEKTRYRNLLRTVTHDIANLLTLIMHHADSSQRSIVSSSAGIGNEPLRKIQKATEMIEDITASVKLWSSSESGEAVVKIRPIELREIVEDLKFLFLQKLSEKRVRLLISDESDLSVKVLGDRGVFVNQIFSNVLSNAYKFSETGGTILLNVERGKQLVNISISDEGIGIPQKILKDLLSPEKRTTRKGTANESGTGFGMPIVQSYMRQLNGDIKITSKSKEDFPNEKSGTCVNIFVPFEV